MGFTPMRWCQRKPKQKADPKARPLRFKTTNEQNENLGLLTAPVLLIILTPFGILGASFCFLGTSFCFLSASFLFPLALLLFPLALLLFPLALPLALLLFPLTLIISLSLREVRFKSITNC